MVRTTNPPGWFGEASCDLLELRFFFFEGRLGWNALGRFLVFLAFFLPAMWREASAASSGNVYLCDVYGAVAFVSFTRPLRVLPLGVSPPEGDGVACWQPTGDAFSGRVMPACPMA